MMMVIIKIKDLNRCIDQTSITAVVETNTKMMIIITEMLINQIEIMIDTECNLQVIEDPDLTNSISRSRSILHLYKHQ